MMLAEFGMTDSANEANRGKHFSASYHSLAVRRPIRILLACCIGASAMVCLAVVAQWLFGGVATGTARYCAGHPITDFRDYTLTVRSSGTGLSFWLRYQRFEPSYMNIVSDDGKLSMARTYQSGFTGNWLSPNEAIFLSPEYSGFRIRRYNGWSTGPGHLSHSLHINLPRWCVILLTAIAPALWLGRRVQKRKTRRAGLCETCGYDLRATPERCPECGATPKAFSKADAIPK